MGKLETVQSLALLYLSLVLLVNGEGTRQDETGVYDFREDAAFDEAIESQPVVCVMYHDPHLGASESVLHEYRLAIKQLKEEGVDIAYGIVDVSNSNTRGLVRRFAIFGLPTFLIFHAGTPHQYLSNFTRIGIMETLREHAKPDWRPDVSANAVLELTADNFEPFINSRRAVMVMFYAPWCNHCKQLEPTYFSAASLMMNHEQPVPFGKLDGSTYEKISSEYNVTGFPTLYLFRNGKKLLYDGARSAGVMTHFIKKRIAKPSTELKRMAGAAKKFGAIARDAVLIGFFSSENEPELETFHELADAFRDNIKAAHMVGGAAMSIGKSEYGVTGDRYAVVILKDQRLPVGQGETKFALFDGDEFDFETGRHFVANQHSSLVNFATQENWMSRFAGTRPLVIVLTDIDFQATNLVHHEINQVAKVAAKYPNTTFAIGDSENLASIVADLGVADNDEDVIACFLSDDSSRYPLPGLFSAEALIEHLESHSRGELKPYLRSQKEPAHNPGPIKTMVASSFERLADTTKDVLVLFMSQVSSDCQKFEAVLKKAVKQFTADSVLFFRYDADMNDLPPGAKDVSVKPTLALWKAGSERSQAPVIYSGKRRADRILEFIRKNAETLQDSAARDEL